MPLRRTNQKLIAAITALVMVFASLAPTWAAALDRAPGVAGWVELCSAAGNKRIAVDADGNPVAPEPSTHDRDNKHCPFCTLQPLPATLPSATTPEPPRAADATGFLPGVYALPPAAPVWPPTRSRAPPVLV